MPSPLSLGTPLLLDANQQRTVSFSSTPNFRGREVLQTTNAQLHSTEERLENTKLLFKKLDSRSLDEYAIFMANLKYMKSITGLASVFTFISVMSMFAINLNSGDNKQINERVLIPLLSLSFLTYICYSLNEKLAKLIEPEESVINRCINSVIEKLNKESISPSAFYLQLKNAAGNDFKVIDDAFSWLATNNGVKLSDGLASKMITAFIKALKATDNSSPVFQCASEKLEELFQPRSSDSDIRYNIDDSFDLVGVEHAESIPETNTGDNVVVDMGYNTSLQSTNFSSLPSHNPLNGMRRVRIESPASL